MSNISSPPLLSDAALPSGTERRGTVLYIHGGGLIFGSAHDLPQPYIDAFTAAGYAFEPLTYPLAPQHKASEILASLEADVAAVRASLGDHPGQIVLLGRSAGAFLALQLQARSIRAAAPLADRVVSLYGYADMEDEGFRTPSAHYLSFGPFTDPGVAPAPDDTVARFSLYVGLRQQGTWAQTVLDTDVSISDETLAQFPPTYLAASAYDPDVPFRCSKRLAQRIPNAIFRRIYDSTEHDVDRDPTWPHGMAMYRDIIDWLQNGGQTARP